MIMDSAPEEPSTSYHYVPTWYQHCNSVVNDIRNISEEDLIYVHADATRWKVSRSSSSSWQH